MKRPEEPVQPLSVFPVREKVAFPSCIIVFLYKGHNGTVYFQCAIRTVSKDLTFYILFIHIEKNMTFKREGSLYTFASKCALISLY